MRSIYARWIEGWENRLCFRSNNRVVRPFEWGLDWTPGWPASAPSRNGHAEEEWLRHLNRISISESDRFFGYTRPDDFCLDSGTLTFSSPVKTPFPENNAVRARWFPANRPSDKAVVVLPHWNSNATQHVALCRALQRLGLSTLRLSLPYHDERMPSGLERADYAVSSNIGRTIDATRQAIVDTRCAADWLEGQGYSRIGLVGTSLGSCYAFLASAHDERFVVNVYNHCSSYFADVVWTGLSTRHIRQSLEEHIGLETLREVWLAISPVSYLRQYARWRKKSKFIYATFDTTFLPRLSEDVLRMIQEQGIETDVVALPCGHYTIGETPYKFIDGYHICSYLKKWL